MAREELLVIVGATGNQGASVIEHVQKQHPAIKIRGLTRDPSSTASKSLQEKGVEMVAADMNDEGSLVNAFKGATIIFAMTDFWNPVFARIAVGDTNNLWPNAIDEELAAGKRIVDAARKTISTLERFIFSSLPGEMRDVPGEQLQGIPWAISKVKISDYISSCPSEGKGKSISDVTQCILPAYYFENFANHQYLYLTPKKDNNGTFVLRAPAQADRPIHMLSAKADTGLYVAAMLAQPPPSAQNKAKPVYVYSQKLTFNQVVEAFQKVTGRKMRYEQMPAGEMAELEPLIGGHFQRMYDTIYTHGSKMGSELIGPAELGVMNKTTSFEEFVRTHDWESFFSD